MNVMINSLKYEWTESTRKVDQTEMKSKGYMMLR